MNFDLPIEQLVKRVDTRFQLGFAAEAKQRVPDREGFVLSPSPLGLHVLACNEDSLAAPVAALRGAYGSSLEVGPPMARLIRGVQVQEPIMHIRISLEARFKEAVKRALCARGALQEDEFQGARFAVLRYAAPLARVIGLPAELTGLASGTARYWIALSHYALVTRDPGGAAA